MTGTPGTINRATLTFESLANLLNEPDSERRWLVEPRLLAAGLSLLVGKPKAGKTTLSRCLALCVARGRQWLGHETQQGVVWCLYLEEKRDEVKRHFKSMGAIESDPVYVFISASPEDGLQQLRQRALAESPALIIVDPLLKFVRVRDANDYAVVTRALEPLLSLVRDTGAHVMAVHHLGKGERAGADAILGSTAILAAVDAALILNRLPDQRRTLLSTQRYGPDLEETVLCIDDETGVVTAGRTKQAEDASEIADAITQFLHDHGEPAEEKEIQAVVEGRRQVKVAALRELVRAGTVSREGAGTRGQPFRYSVAGSGGSTPEGTHDREPERPLTLSEDGPEELEPDNGEEMEPDAMGVEP